MKKRLFMIALSLTLSMSMGIPCFAEVTNRERWNAVIDKVEQEQNAGIYIDNDYLHIVPVDQQNKERMELIVSKIAANANVIVDDIAKYSMEQLEEGQLKADDIWDELELDSICIIQKINGLSVSSFLEWTEERKQLFIQTTGIENVEFETVERLPESQDEGYSIVVHSSYKIVKRPNGEITTEHGVETSSYKGEAAFGGETYYPITLEQKPYIKNDCLMLPVIEIVNMESKYSSIIRQGDYKDITKEKYLELRENDFKEILENDLNDYQKAVLTKNEQNGMATITFGNQRIVVYDGKRDAYVNGNRIGLFQPAEMKENEVFLSIEDLWNMFWGGYSYEDDDGQLNYHIYFYGGQEDIVFLSRFASRGIKEKFRISTEYDGTIFRNESEKTIRVYEKNNHMMIALKDINRVKNEDGNYSITWDNINQTAALKIWGTIAKDAVFTSGSNKMVLNGVEVDMEEPAEIKEDKIYIPITALFEILEIPEEDVVWLEKGKNVVINTLMIR